MKTVILPKISDPPEVQADWIEWSALSDTASFVSWTGYHGNLTQAGSVDALDLNKDQDEDDVLEELIIRVDRELTSRRTACGGEAGFYPYQMTRDGVEYSGNGSDLTYRFLLLLSLFGKDAGPQGAHPERLFEDLSSLALHEYLGGATAGLHQVGMRHRSRVPFTQRLPGAIGGALEHMDVPILRQADRTTATRRHAKENVACSLTGDEVHASFARFCHCCAQTPRFPNRTAFE